jgi:hypothetical protein
LDWSKAGDKSLKPKKDKYGINDYNWMKGEFVWIESGKPNYTWYNGSMKRILLGDKVDPDAAYLNLTEPEGSIKDPGSKIAPFKLMESVNAVDWVNTRMYWGEHEVMPADMALSCVQCHESLKGERICNRCHQDNKDVDFRKIAQKGTDSSYMASKGGDVSP